MQPLMSGRSGSLVESSIRRRQEVGLPLSMADSILLSLPQSPCTGPRGSTRQGGHMVESIHVLMHVAIGERLLMYCTEHEVAMPARPDQHCA